MDWSELLLSLEKGIEERKQNNLNKEEYEESNYDSFYVEEDLEDDYYDDENY